MKNLRRGIRRTVIQHDDLEVGIILCQHCLHASADITLLIPRGDAHRDQRNCPFLPERSRREGLDDDVEMVLIVQPENNGNADQKDESGDDEWKHEVKTRR